MRNALVLTLLILIAASIEAREVILNQDEIRLGKLEQSFDGKSLETLTLLRTKKTPKKVELNFLVETQKEECVAYRKECTYLPATPFCDVQTLDRIGRCGTHTPRTSCDRVCVRKEWVATPKATSHTLKFKNAAQLQSEEREVFEIRLSQKNKKRKKVEVEIFTVESERPYSFRSWLLRKGTTIKGTSL